MGVVNAITGPEPLRRSRVIEALKEAKGHGYERVICSTSEEAVEALKSMSFSPVLVHIKDYEQYPTASYEDLRNALNSTAHRVLIEADKLNKTQESALPKETEIHKIAASGHSYRQALEHCAGAHSTTIDGAAVDYLTKHAGAAGAVSAITALASANINPITLNHVRALAMTENNSGLPWLLLDAIDRGNSQSIAEHIEAIEAPALTAYLAKRLIAAACLAEGTNTALELHTGGLTDAALKQAAQWSQAHSKEAIMQAISACAKADHLAKSGYASEALALAISAYSTMRRSKANEARGIER